MHPDWARENRDQCVAASVPWHFKQFGEWSPEQPKGFIKISAKKYSHRTFAWARDGSVYNPVSPPVGHYPSTMVYRVGKKAAGAILDGQEWREMPA